ncbi:hypothetical protein NM208_g9780 [Fusarium decemcellulare]|uniref:Uncharacterized protein n=1 Tax=Fusarium decemcellulare TaxID=57161 RepID=A0ACC1S0K2_9HYPO|nr:hypothetical protein NM208_g9780 [Fusarium decemcellulare]
MVENQADLPLYKYEPLSAPDAVRVLALSPSTDRAAPLTGDIIQYSRSEEFGKIDASRIYSAVSYVWGDSRSFSHRIVCNSGGSYLSITSNVDSLLRHFRHPVKIRYLWLDAICLNQSDEVEKGVQIPLMGHVYWQAKKTLIWLGEDGNNEAPEIFALMRLFSAIPETLEGKPLDQHMGQSMESRPGAHWLERLNAFLQKQWFFRRWTIQEAVFSHNSVLRWGGHSLEFFRLLSAFHRLDAFRGPLKERYAIKMLTRTSLSGHQLLDLLWTLHRSECSDKRDRIWALYGLLPATERQHINYKSHWSEIFLRHASVALPDREWSGFFLLHLFSFGAIVTDNANFPSWVPDWSNHRRFDFPYLGWSRELDVEPPPYLKGQLSDRIKPRPAPVKIQIMSQDGSMVITWDETRYQQGATGYRGYKNYEGEHRITQVYKHLGAEVFTRGEVIAALEPLLQLRAWEASSVMRSPSRVAVLVASMLIYHGICAGNQLEVSLDVESCLIDYSNPDDPAIPHHNSHLPLMTGFCNLLRKFSLFQMESTSTGYSAWGFGHQSLQEGDTLIPTWSVDMLAPPLQDRMTNGPQFFIMAILRLSIGEPSVAHRFHPVRGRFIGPSFCIADAHADYTDLLRNAIRRHAMRRRIYII